MTTVPSKIPAIYNGSPSSGGSSDFGTIKWFGPYTVNYTAISSGGSSLALILDDAGSNAGILEDIFVQTTSSFSAPVTVYASGYSSNASPLTLTTTSSVVHSLRDSDLAGSVAPTMPNKAIPSFTLNFDPDGATLTTGQCKIYAKYVIPTYGNISLD